MARNSSNPGRGGKPGPRGNSGKNSSNFRGNKDTRPFKKRPDGEAAPDRERTGDREGGSKWADKNRKPFGRDDRPGSDRPPFRAGGDKRSAPYKGARPEADRPFKKRFEGGDGPERKSTFRKEDSKWPNRDRKPFDRDKRDDSRPPASPEGARPYKKKFDDGARPERRPFSKDAKWPRKEAEGEKKSFGREKHADFDKKDRPARPRDENKRTEGSGAKRFDDSRPFRERPKPRDQNDSYKKLRKEATPEGAEKTEEKKFDNVLKNAFTPAKKKKEDADIIKPQQHEDKVYGELEEPKSEVKPVYTETGKGIAGRKASESKFAAKKTDKKEGRRKRYDDDDDEEDEVRKSNFRPGGDDLMPLNKYIAHSGECSRRDAAELVKQGKVKVNGELILDPGHKVKYDDAVTLVGKKLKPQKDNVYILLNKPKGYITTNEDPQGRKTVMQLVENSGADRIFPVGRLDRDTSGLLLITNDGALTQRLCHPSFNIKKVYHVTLDKPLTKAHFEKIVEGVELEDGKAVVDELAYLETKNELGLEIHSGKNRIVRRIFESLGYVVEKLDRMMYAGLTKKNLPRGKWRFLEPREIILLKHFKS